MDLNQLLVENGIDPEKTLVMRHSPQRPDFARIAPWLITERPEVFNAYQQTQYPRVEKQLLRADHLASFYGHEAGKAVFVGIYKMAGSKVLPIEKLKKIRAYSEFLKFWGEAEQTKYRWFDLRLTKHFSEWKAKLVVKWPPREINYSRWALKNCFEVLSIAEESIFDTGPLDWQTRTFSWDELHVLPRKWKEILSQSRGIYLILDLKDGKGYVGSAYGKSNILGRWLNYAKTGHGGNKKLRPRNPEGFRFSILERLSPDTPEKEVIACEVSWKTRLHTCSVGLNIN
jgi:hypothetical protein